MIFQKSVWRATEQDASSIKKYSELFQTEPLITKLLLDRGFDNKNDVDAFFNPSYSQLHNPFLFEDMEKAVMRIRHAIDENESIWIYGDYDVDGITSISVMCRYFKHVGVAVNYYIPDRHDEGYGISIKGIDTIKEHGGRLIITVDSGITAKSEVEYAQKLGVDVIVTDHHECQEQIPDAVAIINPKLGEYPFKMLCGCGVALKLIQALLGEKFQDFADTIIDIVALGTVADIVPLVDENRIFTKIGLDIMQESKILGIRALLHEAGLIGKEVNAGHIGFIIAPRINATGRIGDPKLAVKLLLTDSNEEATKLAQMLSQLNIERQNREKKIFDEAIDYIESKIDLEREKILLVCGEEWHTGIIGIVASKLTERYSRPVVIVNIEAGIAKGSARSVDGISIFDILSRFKSLFIKFGGHEQAAGLTFKEEKLEELKLGLRAYSEKNISFRELINRKRVDGYLQPQMVNHKLIDEIDALKPFGLCNPKPQFAFQELKLEDFKCIGKEQNHLKMIVNDGTRVYDALAFNCSHLTQFLKRQDLIHLLLNLEINNFMGIETIQFLVKDIIKPHLPLNDIIEMMMAKAISNYVLENGQSIPGAEFTRESNFDIIFSASTNNVVFVFSWEGMIRLKDYFFSKNMYNYAIHFNEIDEKEAIDGCFNIIFMPNKETLERYENAIILEEIQGFGYHIPDRRDLMQLYKELDGVEEIDVKKAADNINLTMPKILICLELLEKMKLIEYKILGKRVLVSHQPKPSEKINLEQIELYKKIWS